MHLVDPDVTIAPCGGIHREELAQHPRHTAKRRTRRCEGETRLEVGSRPRSAKDDAADTPSIVIDVGVMIESASELDLTSTEVGEEQGCHGNLAKRSQEAWGGRFGRSAKGHPTEAAA